MTAGLGKLSKTVTSQITRTLTDESPSVGNYVVCLHREISEALNILELKLCALHCD